MLGNHVLVAMLIVFMSPAMETLLLWVKRAQWLRHWEGIEILGCWRVGQSVEVMIPRSMAG